MMAFRFRHKATFDGPQIILPDTLYGSFLYALSTMMNSKDVDRAFIDNSVNNTVIAFY